MKPSLHRPLAWHLAIAFLLLACAISASAQNKNASPAGAPPNPGATEGQVKPPDAGNKNASPAQPSGGAANSQSTDPEKGGPAPTSPAITITSVSNAANPAPKP